MCGINGIIGAVDAARAQEAVQRMNDRMAHRGPDAAGTWSREGVVLGHRRLSIIDTSPAGNQPFVSDDGQLAIVFNGEIFNYLELRKELVHYHFHSGSDTEVILAAYREWGIECVHRFIGMFAFALWDEALQTAFIVRDRLGIKPVYFHDQEGQLTFASEVRSLLSSGCTPSVLNTEALTDYLRYQTVHAPATLVKDVYLLPAGHWIRWHGGAAEQVCYWRAVDRAKPWDASRSREEAYAEVRSLLRSSVELRMRADVPFGAFLSGGIDSSIVVGLMSEVATQPVRTFSITFHEDEWDESQWSNLIARRFGTDHTEIRLHASAFLGLVPDALNAMDHPSGDGPNTFVVSKVTREAGVKMALSGLGGDELFAGYDVFRRMKKLEDQRWLNTTPRVLRSLSGKLLSAVRPSVASEKIAAALDLPSVDFAHAYPLSRRVFSDEEIATLLAVDPSAPNAVFSVSAALARTALPLLSKVSVAEMATYMQHVLLRDTDQMSMAHALEVRVPFLDHRLVETVLGIPDDLKYPHTPKELLTRSVGDLIPREIIDRPKMGFTFPWAVWMKGELAPLCEVNLSHLEASGYFRPGSLRELWSRFERGEPRTPWSRVWPLVVLGHWMKHNGIA